ncbi:MAG: hypothetical protein LBG52_03610 [Candidatus Peribacteria bacterium]|jgi:hypothetical protein|nr:hypothetical protein [Candidatus Peribacteria bacterium]
MLLPKPLNTTLIPQRIKGIKKGKEEHLEGYTNAQGSSTVGVHNDYDQVKYSLEMPLLAPKIANIDLTSYETFKLRSDSKLLEPLLNFDQETDFFLASLKALPLKEQLTNIEQYVRKHAFYDRKNAEVNGIKS